MNGIIAGKRIRECRKARGETQMQLADAIGVSYASISRWENGENQNIKEPIMIALANHFSVNPTWLSGNSVQRQTEIMHEALSKDEQDLIVEYRTLNELQRAHVRGIIKGIIHFPKIKPSDIIQRNGAGRQPRVRRIRRKKIKRTAL